eukprot:5414568-Prymnesium_polylepis.1
METRATAQVGQAEPDEQLPHAEPRVAAAAAPHKRLAVAAGTAVGLAVGVGGRVKRNRRHSGGFGRFRVRPNLDCFRGSFLSDSTLSQ